MSSDKDRSKYRVDIQQMMFVSGETNDPPVETTTLIEDIVRAQVVELILQSSKTAASRGTKSISAEDVIFIIRHDKAKVNRLRSYLSWKDVRKNAKDQESGDIGTGNDLIEETAGATVGGPSSGAASGLIDNKMVSKYKKSKIRLPWELQFMFSEQPLETNDDDVGDDEEKEATIASLKRLKANDERTKNMTKEEYVHWSECRQASFTFRKAKRFKEWCGLSQLTESRPQDDVIDILGFLTFEMVCSITEVALKVKSVEERIYGNSGGTQMRERKHYLFDVPDKTSTPILQKHVEEAWRKLQEGNFKSRAIRNFGGGRIRSRVQFI